MECGGIRARAQLMLAVIDTHPVQYRAPVYRALEHRFGLQVTAVYGSDASLVGYRDSEFGVSVTWDTDLLSGYRSVFLSSRLRNSQEALPDWRTTRRVKIALAEIRPRAVLVVGYSPRFYRVAASCAWHMGVPVLFRGETTDHAWRRGLAKRIARDWMLRRFYGGCARLLYLGRRSYEHFRRLGCAEEKLIFSPYCVDASTFRWNDAARAELRSAGRTDLGVDERDSVLLFSGKLSARKGPDLLLRAVKESCASVCGRIIVVFLGDGPMRESLRALAQDTPRTEVRLLGFRNQSELSRYYHAADVLVLPSLQGETWGLVVNEALQHGLPCVLSAAVGCVPDLIDPGTTGEVFDTGSVKSLAAALGRAMRLVGRADVRAQCREKVGGYTIERAAEGIARAYRAVVGTPARAGAPS